MAGRFEGLMRHSRREGDQRRGLWGYTVNVNGSGVRPTRNWIYLELDRPALRPECHSKEVGRPFCKDEGREVVFTFNPWPEMG
jgi:hypothetical protein